MVMGIFAGLVVICFLIAVAFIMSLAIQFWFLSIPLFFVILYFLCKREGRRQRNFAKDPVAVARHNGDMALIRADNAMFRDAKARNKALRKG